MARVGDRRTDPVAAPGQSQPQRHGEQAVSGKFGPCGDQRSLLVRQVAGVTAVPQGVRDAAGRIGEPLDNAPTGFGEDQPGLLEVTYEGESTAGWAINIREP
jgi:hypothetical protein